MSYAEIRGGGSARESIAQTGDSGESSWESAANLEPEYVAKYYTVKKLCNIEHKNVEIFKRMSTVWVVY